MKKLFTLFLTVICTQIFAQPDLICSNVTSTQSTIYFGQQLFCSFRIKNIGNQTAGLSHATIYLLDSASNTRTSIADVSTEALTANTETSDYYFNLPLPWSVPYGHSHIEIIANSRVEVNESNIANNYRLSSNTLNILNYYVPFENLPYPIILVHGLNSNDSTWYPFISDMQNNYGYCFGGNMDFCLNQDGNIHTSNITNPKLPYDFKDRTDETQLSKGDFYTINFDIDSSGKKYNNPATTQSNQSAILKQGIAIQKAIQHVLNVTGRDKVILLGHSMGGLASREYLQNKSNWQADGKHHVAKLETIGTPHGGSNATSFGFQITPNLDQKSEAVRDLRETFGVVFPSNGIYLYGGTESYSMMPYGGIPIGANYNNVDVNCNGIDGDGSNITGLNNKSIPTDLPYSCIIGESKLLAGDGVVGTKEANLNNYLPQVAADTFFSNEITPIYLGVYHSVEPQQTSVLMKGLDEPDNIKFAFTTQLNNYNYGHFNKKNGSSTSQVDSDYYKVTVPSSGLLTTNIYNLSTPNVGFKLIDSVSNKTYSYKSNGRTSGAFVDSVQKGTYYLNMYSIPDTSDLPFPYAFKFNFTPSTLPVEIVEFNTKITNDLSVLTSWQTVSELNTLNFVIQHSTDGIFFTNVGIVNAIGSGSNDYHFTDNKPANGINYYRLESVDKDGSITFSNLVSVNFASKESFSIIPNPARNFTTISFSKAFDNATIVVYDVTGKQIIAQVLNGSTNTYKLNTEALSNGLYVIKVVTSTGSYNEKLLINK